MDLQRFGIDPKVFETTGFRFMHQEDWELLLDNAQLVVCPAETVLIQQGIILPGIYIVKKGTLRVEQTRASGPQVLARRGPGALLGDMSVLENTTAMANVIANVYAEVYQVETGALIALFNNNPIFALRFYHSLAVNLAQRLREAADLLDRIRSQPDYMELTERRGGLTEEQAIERIARMMV